MNIKLRLMLVASVILAAPVQAADYQQLMIGVMQTAFTGDYGDRDIASVEYLNKVGESTYVVNVAAGERGYDDALSSSFKGQSFSGTYYHDWNKDYTTRSHVAVSTNSPVFVRRLFDQDVTYKGIANTTLTAGVKHAEYYGDVGANAWYVSGAYYMDRITTRVRFTQYDLSGIGSSYGTTLMFHVKDPSGAGATQLWLGNGTSIQEYIWSPVAKQGHFKSVALKRIQPLNQQFSLTASLEQAWYHTTVADYRGVTGHLGVAYKW